jgi:hypothetical protein
MMINVSTSNHGREVDDEDAYKNELEYVRMQMLHLSRFCLDEAKGYASSRSSTKGQPNDGEQVQSKSWPLLLTRELDKRRRVALLLAWDRLPTGRSHDGGRRWQLLCGDGVRLLRGHCGRGKTPTTSVFEELYCRSTANTPLQPKLSRRCIELGVRE